MQQKEASNLIFFVALVLLTLGSVDCHARKLKLCSISKLFACYAEPIAQFTSQHNGTGIVNTEAEFEQYCFNNHDYMPYCVKKWFESCAVPLQMELAQRLFVNPMQQSMKVFCDSKGTIRSKFLKHSSCLIRSVKLSTDYRNTCVRDIQANNEYVHNRQRNHPNMGHFIRGFCCAYNQWEACITGFLRRNCGQDAADIFPSLIHHASIDVIKGLCPVERYNPADDGESGECWAEIFRAPSHFTPQGYKSDSFMSYYFTYLCPNVGWGLDEKRDSVNSVH